MKTDSSRPVTGALARLNHCSPQGLFDYFSELEEIIRNPVMLPRQHSSLEKKTQNAMGTKGVRR